MAKQVRPALVKPAGRIGCFSSRPNDEERERRFHQGPERDSLQPEAGYMTASFLFEITNPIFCLHKRAGPYMRPTHQVRGDVIGEDPDPVQALNQGEAEDLGHLRQIPEPARIEDDLIWIPNVKRFVGGEDVKMTVPVEFVAMGLNQRNQCGAEMFLNAAVAKSQ